jgi:hypothetical protein
VADHILKITFIISVLNNARLNQYILFAITVSCMQLQFAQKTELLCLIITYGADISLDLLQIDEGWWRGYCHGQYGLFPANYVQLQQ